MHVPNDFKMDPSFTIGPSDEVGKNLNWFREQDFFEPHFPLTRMEKPLKLSNNAEKDYYFPTLYGDVTNSVAIFLCDFVPARELLIEIMGAEDVEPARAFPTKSMVIFSSFHYEKVSGLDPYNEIAISIPVVDGGKMNVPLLSLRNHTYFVISMPVTTQENQERGRKIWGLPKEVQSIHHFVEGEDYVTVAKSNEPYLEFRVPWSTEKEEELTQSVHLLSLKDGHVWRATSRSRGTFATTQNLEPISRSRTKPRLKIIGESPMARQLRRLNIEEHSFETRFGTGVSSLFDLPRRNDVAAAMI